MSTTKADTAPRAAVDSIRVTPWSDPLIDRLGHDPRSTYVERYWLGILGPSTVWLIRHCAGRLESSPAGFDLDLFDVAAALGLGHRGGRNSPLARSILRACRFGAARTSKETELQVRRRMPPLNLAQVERLPDSLRRSHHQLTEQQLDIGDIESQRRRARRLALGLVACDEPVDGAEIQLGRWRVHPSIAAEAVRWAWNHHDPALAEGPEAA